MTISSGARAAGRSDYAGDDRGRPRAAPARPRCLNHEIKRLNRIRLAGSLVAGPLIVMIALFSAPHWLPVPVSITAGLGLVVGGLALRLWALGCIDGNKKCRLVEWGPYRYVRHPLYEGSLLYLVGFCILAASLTAAAISGLVFLGLYLPAARAEERLLATQYGNRWDAYRQDSGALVPKLVPHQPATRMPFHIRRPYREVGALLALLLLAIAFARIIHLARHAQQLPAWFL